MAAVKPQVFTVQCAHRVLLLHIRRVLCVLLLVLIESLLLFRSEVAVPWVHTHPSAFGFPKNSVVLTFLSWILSRVASRAPGCACVEVQRWRLPCLAPLPLPPPAPLTSQCTVLTALRAVAPPRALPAPAEEGVEVSLQRLPSAQ